MAELKTKANDGDVEAFLASVADPQRREDAKVVCALMREITKEPPRMWGDSIVGFGEYRYRYATGREGDWLAVGFSPRKQNLTLYIMDGFGGYDELLSRLGKHATGKSCLYLKRLSDVDTRVLRELIKTSYRTSQRRP